MLHSKCVSTPLAQQHDLTSIEGVLVDPTVYRSIVGALQYLTLTRPEISHAVNLVCQYMQSPTHEHVQVVILRYVNGTIGYGMRITSQSTLSLYAFSDTDWAGCPQTRRFTTGYCIFLGANCISWSSKK